MRGNPKREGRTLVVLGGGNPFTAALIDSLAYADRPLVPRLLVLQGRDVRRLGAVVRYGAARLQPLGWDVRGETDMATALSGAATVIHQIRYGGLARELRGSRAIVLRGSSASDAVEHSRSVEP